ncbi:MAG: hypothetical protein QOD70_3471, partial [Frankiales bacterium]|nr:hypothetical protein [Frankiales bacterium]
PDLDAPDPDSRLTVVAGREASAAGG